MAHGISWSTPRAVITMAAVTATAVLTVLIASSPASSPGDPATSPAVLAPVTVQPLTLDIPYSDGSGGSGYIAASGNLACQDGHRLVLTLTAERSVDTGLMLLGPGGGVVRGMPVDTVTLGPEPWQAVIPALCYNRLPEYLLEVTPVSE